MTGNPPVIVATDGSVVSHAAVAWAAVDAGLHGAPLEIVTSVAVPGGWGPGAMLIDTDTDYMRLEGERVVTDASRVARNAAVGDAVTIDTTVTFELPIPYLIDRSRQARLLVVGSRGHGAFGRALLGSVSTAVTRHAHCPVAVVHSNPALDPVSAEKPVLVGVDGTPNSVPALEFAFEEASRRKVGLDALHAWSDTSGAGLPLSNWDLVRERETELLAERLAGFGERYPDVAVRRILVRHRPIQSLLEATDNAQLLVVGSHGRGGFAGMLLGSTSNALLHSVECPMIVVPSR
ncbi:universal stress protein [Nocardia sp. ET3-3]|uniref:Universal stress protein n=1 Tax=Nocardia terrae TaxID=2675851 RepID=A0A7K1UVS2_9NOCA|nr:universal stress protein [Nocardia terrae]MVU78361.1 universal stress protein [Nocardia terrae]